MELIVDAINHIVVFIASVCGVLLPDDPFRGVISDLANNSDLSNGLAMLNWFVPFGNLSTFIGLAVGALFAVLALKFVQWLVKFIADAIPVV